MYTVVMEGKEGLVAVLMVEQRYYCGYFEARGSGKVLYLEL